MNKPAWKTVAFWAGVVVSLCGFVAGSQYFDPDGTFIQVINFISAGAGMGITAGAVKKQKQISDGTVK